MEADLWSLELVAKAPEGVVSYGNAATSGPPVAPVVTILYLLGAGGCLVAEEIAMASRWGSSPVRGRAIGDALLVAGNPGELALLAGLILTISQLPSDAHAREK